MRHVASVEDIVLEHEEDIKHNREESQTKLGWITKQSSPVIIVVSYQKHLNHAQSSSCEVQQDVANAPTNSALPPRKYFQV